LLLPKLIVFSSKLSSTFHFSSNEQEHQTMSTTQASPKPRRQRVKTNSSLLRMLDEAKSQETAPSALFVQYSLEDREEVRKITRKLRQAKRKLLLKCAEQPATSVDKFREIFLGLSVDTTEDEDDVSSTNSYEV